MQPTSPTPNAEDTAPLMAEGRNWHTVKELHAMTPEQRASAMTADASTVTTQQINAYNRSINTRAVEHQQRLQRLKSRYRNMVKRLVTYSRKVVDRMPQGDRQEAERARVHEQMTAFAQAAERIKA